MNNPKKRGRKESQNNKKKGNIMTKVIETGAAYAELELTTLSKILRQRLSVPEAIKLRDALSRTIAICEVSKTEPKLQQFNMVVITTHKHSGQITTLAKKRINPFRKGEACATRHAAIRSCMQITMNSSKLDAVLEMEKMLKDIEEQS